MTRRLTIRELIPQRSPQLAPKLNGIQIGFPYVTQFLFEHNAKRLADERAAKARAGTEPKPGGPRTDEQEALISLTSRVIGKLKLSQPCADS